jgi:hypothetical protein
MNYWDETSILTTRGPSLVRLPSPPSSPWEYAKLKEELKPGGEAKCEIWRPNSSDALIATGHQVLVRDRILNGSLVSGTQITIRQYGPTGGWELDSWHCQYAI